MDTWWQTETGAIMITPLPGITATKPGSATHPFPGVGADVLGESTGEPVAEGQGLLVLKRPEGRSWAILAVGRVTPLLGPPSGALWGQVWV